MVVTPLAGHKYHSTIVRRPWRHLRWDQPSLSFLHCSSVTLLKASRKTVISAIVTATLVVFCGWHSHLRCDHPCGRREPRNDDGSDDSCQSPLETHGALSAGGYGLKGGDQEGVLAVRLARNTNNAQMSCCEWYNRCCRTRYHSTYLTTYLGVKELKAEKTTSCNTL